MKLEPFFPSVLFVFYFCVFSGSLFACWLNKQVLGGIFRSFVICVVFLQFLTLLRDLCEF